MPQSGGELCLISQGEAVEKASSLGWDRLVPKTVGSSWPQEVSRWVAKCSLRVSHEPQGLGEQPDYLHPLAKLAERKWNKTNETVALHKTKRGKGLLQKEKGFTAGQPSKETGGKAQICLPNGLLCGVVIVEVGSKMRRQLWNIWWKWRSFRNSVHIDDCPSCLFMGGMCSIRIVPHVIHGRFLANSVQSSQLIILVPQCAASKWEMLLVSVPIPSSLVLCKTSLGGGLC